MRIVFILYTIFSLTCLYLLWSTNSLIKDILILMEEEDSTSKLTELEAVKNLQKDFQKGTDQPHSFVQYK